MWEQKEATGASSSSISGNRGFVLLASVIGVCLLLYSAWGPLLLVSCTLVAVTHACYSLLVNDSLLSPNTLLLGRYTRQLALELARTLKLIAVLGYNAVLRLIARFDRTNKPQDMSGRHRNVYRLSTNDLGENDSPISLDSFNLFASNGACNSARTSIQTSTPIQKRGTNWRKEIHQNGGIGLSIGTPQANIPQSLRNENKRFPIAQCRSEDILPKSGTHWSSNISPKTRDKEMHMKTVQTTAGPLLNSSRYNIDPKLYTDISSPGLTTRINKYAAEANNRLIHQHQYGAGQFPKVNLNASPTPLLSPKVARARIPVTVRVAPPEVMNYTPSPDGLSNQDRPKIFGNYTGSEIRESKSCPSVAQVLKEISLKRHASREDIMLELVKKQRTERILEGQLENLEEMMHKRARDESVTSEEDSSPQSRNQRPLKKPKSSSCHDVLNSLSSSVHILSGVKRKAMDTSRCNTPDIEKHFKPSSPSRSPSSPLLSFGEPAKSKNQLNVKVTPDIKQQYPEVSKSCDVISREKSQSYSSKAAYQVTPKVHKEISDLPKPALKPEKLTDKLFMKAETQTNEKLKHLIERQGNVDAVFTTDDKDEIRKEDIVNMRQNSMRLRLQNMFDAVSGKSASKIDPDVVIQAEEINPPESSNFASLNSLTTTTTVNTSPITTTIVPILKNQDVESTSPNTKHVTFNLPSTSSSLSSNSTSTASNFASFTKPDVVTAKPIESTVSTFKEFNTTATTSSSAPTFNFNSGSSAVAVSSASQLPAATGFNTTFDPMNFPKAAAPSSTVNTTNTSITSSLFTSKSPAENSIGVSSSGFTFGTSKIDQANITSTISSAPATSISTVIPVANMAKTTELSTTSSSTTGFSFGNALAKSPATTSIAQTMSTLPSSTSEKKGGFSFGAPTTTSVTNTTAGQQTSSIFAMPTTNSTFSTNASAPATTSMFSFNSDTNKTSSSGFSFGSTTTSTTANTATSTPVFGQTSVNVNAGDATSTFAQPAISGSMSSPSVTATNTMFGNSSTNSLFGNAFTNSPNFFSGSSNSSMFNTPNTTGTATTTAPSIFGAQSNTPSFGAPSVPATTIPSLFGNTSTPSSTTPSLFGNVAATSSTASPTMSVFGNTTPQQPVTQASIFSAGGAAPVTTTPSIFGSSTSAPATGLFSAGSSNASAAIPTLGSTTNPPGSASIFGQSKSPTFSFGGSNSAFGSTNTTSNFTTPTTTPNTFQIGGNTNSGPGGLPSFNTIKPSTQFGAPTTQPSTGSIFGSASSTSGSFGSQGASTVGSGSAFGSTNAAPSFGAVNNTSNFGSSTTSSFGATSTASSPFGAPQTTSSGATSLFGSAAPAPSTSGSSFNFGGTPAQPLAQPQAQPLTQSAPNFSFGSNSSTGAPSGVFQFGGASTSQKPAGFNFNAPTAGNSAQPTFNAPPPGNMFNIGSGSSTPRSRSSRQRRQR